MQQKMPTNPGFYLDDTPLSAMGFYTGGDKIRFVRGQPQTHGGWELLSTTALTGFCRGLHSWADNNLVKWIGAGTNTNLFAITDSTVYDVTPVITYGTLTNPFATDGTTAIITVTFAAHGMITGQYISWPGLTAINGATITGTKLYPITFVTANSFTFVADTVSTSAGAGVGGTVNYRIYLAPGLADGIGALGYGTGVYSTGSTYSSPASGATYPRTWSVQNYGQNLLASPRGGKLYEWAPIVGPAELTTNGTFAGSSTGWTLGAGWTYGANSLVAAASGAAFSQNVTTPVNAFVIVQIVVSAAGAGTLQGSLGGTNFGTAISTPGTYTTTIWSSTGGTASLAFTGTGFTGTVTSVSLKQMATAEVVPNAPTQNTCMIVTSEGFVMVGGTTNVATGAFDPMLVRWSDIGTKTNAEQTWTPASNNLSGFFRPLIGSRVVGMRICNNEILIWTDKALYAAIYVANSALVYSLRLVGADCGLIGVNAAAIIGGMAEWMTPSGAVYQYMGGVPMLVKCPVQQDMFNNLAFVQQDKIWASPVAQYGDIFFFYPDSRDGNECSRYIMHNTLEIGPPLTGTSPGIVGVFATGTFLRTAWIDSGIHQYPIAVDTSGFLYFQEKGQTANGANFTWSLTTGAMQIGNGITQWAADTFVPDFQQLIGGFTLTAKSYYWPQSSPVTHGPFSVSSMSEQINMLSDAPVGREVSMTFSGNATPAHMRMGSILLNVVDTGMTF